MTQAGRALTGALMLSCCCNILAAQEISETALRTALNKPLTLKLSDKSFAEVVKAVCAAVDVELQAVEDNPPQPGSSGSGRKGMVGGVKGNVIGYRNSNAARSYSLEINAPISALKVLSELCEQEGVLLSMRQGKLSVGLSVADFDPDAIWPGQPIQRQHTPERDWRRAIASLEEESARWSKDLEEGRSYRIADYTPLDKALDAAMSGLKGHPEKDAIRLWLLCEATGLIWAKFGMRNASRELATALAAFREARELAGTAAATMQLDELAKHLKTLYQNRANYPQRPPVSAATPDSYFTDRALQYAYQSAARASSDRAQAVAFARTAARMHLAIDKCDHVYDFYYHVVLGAGGHPCGLAGSKRFPDEQLKAIEADIAEFEKKSEQLSKPCKARFHFRYGAALTGSQKYKEAIAQFEKAIALDPNEGGYTEYEQRSTFSDPFRDRPPENARAWLALAEACRLDGQVERALQILHQKVKEMPAEFLLVMKLAETYRAAARAEEADKWLAQARELRPNDPRVQSRQNVVTVSPTPRRPDELQTLLAEARTALMHAKSTAHLEKTMGAEKARELGREPSQPKFEATLAKIQQGLTTYPKESTLLELEVECLQALNRGSEAENALKKLTALDPARAEARRDAANKERLTELIVSGRKEEALALTREFSATAKDSSSYIREEFKLLQQLGRYEEAYRFYDKHAQGFGSETNTLQAKILALWGVGRTDEAEKELQRFEAEAKAQPAYRSLRDLIQSLKDRLKMAPKRGNAPTTGQAGPAADF